MNIKMRFVDVPETFSIIFNNFNSSNIYLFTIVTIIISSLLTFYWIKFARIPKICKENEEEKLKELESDDDNENENLSRGLLGKMKLAKLAKYKKELKDTLSEEQILEEKNVEREQLTAILKLLKVQETELNTREMDEKELLNQLKLYR